MSGGLGEWDTDPPGVDPDVVAERLDVEVEREVRRQVRRIARQAVANELTPEVIDDLHAHAETASHTELTTPTEADEPPPLYYGSVDEFVREIVCPTFRRRVGNAPRAGGTGSGGATPRRSCAWTRCGGPGNTCAATPPPE